MILLALAGCLPHGAVSRGEPMEGTAYELRWADAPADAPPVRVTRQFARTFVDGTSGWAVCVDGDTECVELRSFATGEVVQVRGVGAWPAKDRGRFAVLWPLLSPHLDRDAGLYTGWPVGPVTHANVRLVARGGWTGGGKEWSWSAPVESQGLSVVTLAGKVEATVHLQTGQLRDATWTASFPWCIASGGCIEWAAGGTITRVGTAPAREIRPCPQHGEDAARAPLCIAGGAPIDDPPGGLDVVSFLGGHPAETKTGTVEGEPPP